MPRIADETWLSGEALANQIGWFEAFDGWQAERFVLQLLEEAERLKSADNPSASAFGKRIGETIDRSQGNVLRLLGELAGLRDDLAAFARSLGKAPTKPWPSHSTTLQRQTQSSSRICQH